MGRGRERHRVGSYGGNGELAVLNLSRVKAGAIMVGGDPANPGSDGAGVLRIGAGAVIETGQVAAPAAGAGSVIADGGVLRLTGGQPALFSGFKTGDIRLGANGLSIDTQGYAAVTVASLSGQGGLTKTGTGTLTLDAANNHQGLTTRRRRVERWRQRQLRRQRRLFHQWRHAGPERQGADDGAARRNGGCRRLERRHAHR